MYLSLIHRYLSRVWTKRKKGHWESGRSNNPTHKAIVTRHHYYYIDIPNGRKVCGNV